MRLYTGSDITPGQIPAGSVCTICQLGGPRQIWRVMDAATANIDLDATGRMR